MNIWDWVHQETDALRESGNDRLADLIDEVPDAVINDRHLEAEGMVHEGVALARALKRPWIELYLRHWDLQSRVLHRNHGRAALSDAIDLVDFAHRPETTGCPQAICTIQDLSSCYGRTDGVGYFEARRQVVEETLARIEPTRACYQCLGGQLIEAFTDAERPTEALEAWERLEKRRGAAALLDDDQEPFETIEPLISLGRTEDALAELERVLPHDRDNDHVRLLRRVQRARIYARLERTEDASTSLPAFEEIASTGALHWSWVDGVTALCRIGGMRNDAKLGAQVQRLVFERESLGAFYEAITLGEMQAQLAIWRGARAIADLALAGIERRIPHLHGRAHGDKVAERVRAAIAAVPAWSLDERSIELALENTTNPVTRGAILDELGFRDEATATLEGAPLGHDRNVTLGHILRQMRDPRPLEQLIDQLLEHDAWRIDAFFLRGLRARSDGDTPRALAAFREVVAIDPNAKNTRAFIAEMLLLEGDFAGALVHLDDLAEAAVRPPVTHWDRMAAAAALDDWARVRASARALELSLPEGEGPIDEEAHVVRVERRTDGKPERLYARATSPVTARVLSVTTAGRQRFGDRIVFRPVPIDGEPTGDPPLFCYPELVTVEEGGYGAWDLDGVHPGEAALDRLGDGLAERGIQLQVRSGEHYRVGDDLPGLFAWVIAPAAMAPSEILAAIEALMSGAPHPLVSVPLARATGELAPLARALELSEAYALDVPV